MQSRAAEQAAGRPVCPSLSQSDGIAVRIYDGVALRDVFRLTAGGCRADHCDANLYVTVHGSPTCA